MRQITVGQFIAERTPGNYGFSVRDTKNGEWELVVMLSPGQGGATAIGIVFAQCDQGMDVRLGEAGEVLHDMAPVLAKTKDLIKEAGLNFWGEGSSSKAFEEIMDDAFRGIFNGTFR